jgi:hypothetical protein
MAIFLVRLYPSFEAIFRLKIHPDNYARSLIASAVEIHLAICIACAPVSLNAFLELKGRSNTHPQAIRAMLSRFCVPHVKDAYYSSRDRLSRMQTLTSSSAPPHSPQTILSTPTKKSFHSTIHSKFYSSHIGPFSWTLKRPSTTTTRDAGLENMDHDFHDKMPNPLPTIHTLIAHGPNPRSYTSKKEDDRIYIKREILTRETFLRDATPSQMSDGDVDGDVDIDSNIDLESNVDVEANIDVESTSCILVVPPLAYFEQERDERSCACQCHPGRVVSPAHLCGWCTAECY